METNLEGHYRQISENMIKKLEKRNMTGYLAETPESAVLKILDLVGTDETVAWGGSVTLNTIGIKEKLRERGQKLINTDDYSQPREKQLELRRAGLMADVYLTGVNAITRDGVLVNLDGNCNRVAATLYGPKKVIIVTGANKIVATVEAAIERIRSHAAPINARRLNKKTPCVLTGVCQDCDSPDRICSSTVITTRQSVKDRLHLIIIPGEYGY